MNLSTKFKIAADGSSLSNNLKPCVSFAGEYLIPAEHLNILVSSLDFLKFGVGFKYLLPTRFITDNLTSAQFSYLPIYFTLQINPFVKSNDEYLERLFLKGDIGYNAYFSSNFKELMKGQEGDPSIKDKGGLYYAFGAGYEFPSGLVFDITYGIYKSSIIEITDNETIGLTYSCVGLNVGYKFKIQK